MNFFLFFVCQSTALSSRAVDGHQMYMYCGGSVVGKASTISIEISPIPPLIFTGVKKCEIWRRFQYYWNLSRPRLKMQQDIQTLKQTNLLCRNDRPMSSLSLVKLSSRTPENRWAEMLHHLKLHGVKRAKSSITLTQPWIVQFCWNFVQSLNTWQSKCHRSSSSRGQRSRAQRDITYRHQKSYNSGTDELVKVKLCENYLRAERNTLHSIQGLDRPSDL